MTVSKKQAAVPSELGNVTQDTADRLEERLDKCYSKEDYKCFQEDVTKISLATIGSEDGRTAVKKHAKEAAKDFFEEDAWRKMKFWIPTIISVLAVAVAIFAILKK